MTWTRFMDMHSGGGLKESPFAYIFIQADEEKAKLIFYNVFGHNPDRVTCTCCGSDYSIDSEESLESATAFERGCEFVTDYAEEGGGHYIEAQATKYSFDREYQSITDFMMRDDNKFITQGEIAEHPEWTQGSVPEQGYVWV